MVRCLSTITSPSNSDPAAVPNGVIEPRQEMKPSSIHSKGLGATVDAKGS